MIYLIVFVIILRNSLVFYRLCKYSGNSVRTNRAQGRKTRARVLNLHRATPVTSVAGYARKKETRRIASPLKKKPDLSVLLGREAGHLFKDLGEITLIFIAAGDRDLHDRIVCI